MTARKIIKLIFAVGAVGLVTLLVIVGIFWIALSRTGFQFLPNDCPGTQVEISGVVEGISGATVRINNEAYLYNGRENVVSVETQSDGSFTTKGTSIHAFICERVTVTASADGYRSQQMFYTLLDIYSEDQLVALMEKSPISLHFSFRLQPAVDN
ncbi:MAG: hypothetical protein KF726_23090 [Anaerolineae bacterium]|nr:hypothetical protein [Anaerolineae bacterium]